MLGRSVARSRRGARDASACARSPDASRRVLLAGATRAPARADPPPEPSSRTAASKSGTLNNPGDFDDLSAPIHESIRRRRRRRTPGTAPWTTSGATGTLPRAIAVGRSRRDQARLGSARRSTTAAGQSYTHQLPVLGEHRRRPSQHAHGRLCSGTEITSWRCRSRHSHADLEPPPWTGRPARSRCTGTGSRHAELCLHWIPRTAPTASSSTTCR